MKINCSAGKGILEVEDCLKCALDHPPCGYDYAVLKSMLGTREDRSREIHVTDLLGCALKSYWDKTDPSPEYPHETLARYLGTAVHASVEGSDHLLESELPLAFEDLVGKADIVYRDGRVVDIKTTRWLYPAKVPYGSHSLQVNVYAWLLRKAGRKVTSLQIQYIDASGPSKCRKCKVPVRMFDGELKCPQCFGFVTGAHLGALLVDIPILPDSEIEDFIRQRKGVLSASIDMGLPPEAEPGYLCNYCAHRDRCEVRPEEV